MILWILLLLGSVWSAHAQSCLFGDPVVQKCRVLNDLLFTPFNYTTGGQSLTMRVSTFNSDHVNAELACRAQGLKLFESRDWPLPDVIEALESMNPYDMQSFHIAGRRNSGTFTFLDGSQIPAQALEWHQGEPSITDGRNIEDCLALQRRTGQWRLNDVKCWARPYRYICH